MAITGSYTERLNKRSTRLPSTGELIKRITLARRVSAPRMTKGATATLPQHGPKLPPIWPQLGTT
eukprot:12417215-Karenia_brevis.AAC.1